MTGLDDSPGLLLVDTFLALYFTAYDECRSFLLSWRSSDDQEFFTF